MLILQSVFLLFPLLSFSPAHGSARDSIEIDYYYTVDSGKDADYFISQVIPELESKEQSLTFYTLPIGGVEFVKDELGNKYCHSKKDVCKTSQLQYCISAENPNSNATQNFLKCYFQSELFSVDILAATQNCLINLQGQNGWETVEKCSQDDEKMANYHDAVIYGQQLRPIILETPHVYLNDESPELAMYDLKKALCRVTATDIWSCESVDQYKEPLVEIFYTVYEEDANNFFSKKLTQSVMSQLLNTASRVDLIPNPNKVLNCNSTTDDACWSHQAHWCIFEDYSNADQLGIIQCTFGKPDSLSAQDKVKQCVPEDRWTELVNCVTQTIGSSSHALKIKADKLNLQVDQTAQSAVEVFVKGFSNVKVKGTDGILSEICYNFFHIDDETLGCKVKRPKVQIFYETNSKGIWPALSPLMYYPLLTPFETIFDIEFIPYGNTKYEGGNYTCTSGASGDAEKRCFANFIHACLLKSKFQTVYDKFRFFNFFLCTADFVDGVDAVDQTEVCLNQNFIEGPSMWGELHFCAMTDDELKQEMRSKTEGLSGGLAQIPEIAIDGVKKTTEVADGKLLEYICTQSTGIKARACSNFVPVPGYFTAEQLLQVTLYVTGDQSTESFVQAQLKPLIEAMPRDERLRLRDLISWRLVPWGASSYNSTDQTIECATGANECLTNRVLACASRQAQNGVLGNREDRARVVAFLVCFLKSPSDWQTDPLSVGLKCSSKLSPLDNYPQLWRCAVDASQQPLMLEMRDQTENNYPALSKFPAVAIDSQQGSLGSGSSLVQLLCARYQVKVLTVLPGADVPVECLDFITTPTTTTSTDNTIAPTVTPPPGGRAFQLSQLSTITLILLTVAYWCFH